MTSYEVHCLTHDQGRVAIIIIIVIIFLSPGGDCILSKEVISRELSACCGPGLGREPCEVAAVRRNAVPALWSHSLQGKTKARILISIKDQNSSRRGREAEDCLRMSRVAYWRRWHLRWASCLGVRLPIGRAEEKAGLRSVDELGGAHQRGERPGTQC